jgi:hypothetical protein
MSLAFALALNLAALGGPSEGSWSVAERFSGTAMSLYQLRTDGEAIYWLSCPGLMKPCSLNRLAASAKKPTVVTADFELGGVYAVDRDGAYPRPPEPHWRVCLGTYADISFSEHVTAVRTCPHMCEKRAN